MRLSLATSILLVRSGTAAFVRRRETSAFFSSVCHQSDKGSSVNLFQPSSSSFATRHRFLSVKQQMVSSSTNDNKSDGVDIKYPYPLIDVDCNLLHSDLTSVVSSPVDTSINQHFQILHHPSTSLSNIHAVFSPTSTIDEAETFYPLLCERQQKQTDGDTHSAKNMDIRMSVGVHPYHTGKNEVGEFQSVEQEVEEKVQKLLTSDENDHLITCIGEAGLDYSEGFPEREEQLPWFKWQLKLAKKYQLPLFLHERLAFEDTIKLVDEVFPKNESSSPSSPPILIHCFTGNSDECQQYIERGYYISVSGFILKNGDGPEEIRSCLKEGLIPLDKLMIETDAPYMGFNTCRASYFEAEADILKNEEFTSLNSKKKKRLTKAIYPNVPSSLPKVLECVVELINEGREERNEETLETKVIAQHLFDNSVSFFRFQTTSND